MSNSKNSNLEDVSKGNDESAPGASDSTSNKKTRFTKSKSISEVFKELEIEDNEENVEFSDKPDCLVLSGSKEPLRVSFFYNNLSMP